MISYTSHHTIRNNRIQKCIVNRRINLPVIVTGNGSIGSSHLPNGQPLIIRQTNVNASLPITNGLSTNGSVSLTSHCISNNNNIANININESNRRDNQASHQLQQQQIPLKAISWNHSIDVWWHKAMDDASSECEPVWVDAEDPLFILYTR